MSDTTATESKPRSGRAARRFGYLVAIGVNLILLYVVNNLLEWEWPSFLTEDFERVVGIVSFSIIVLVGLKCMAQTLKRKTATGIASA